MRIFVESAVELDAKQAASLESVLKDKVSGKFTVDYVINPDVLGGLRITIDSQRIDLSLLGKLEQVKKQLE